MALARTFFRDAPLVILEEPTAALDAKAEHELFARIGELFADLALPAEAFKEFFRIAYQPVLPDVIFAGDVWSSMTWIPACQSGNSGSVMLILKSRRNWRPRTALNNS